MNAIIVHGFAHRMLSVGIIESAPLSRESASGDFLVLGSEFRQRSAEEMDLTGGDVELIRLRLQELSTVFFTGEKRLAQVRPMMPVVTGEEPRVL